MKIQRVLWLVLITGCLFLSRTAVAAEESAKTREPSPPTEVFDLSFPGGTVLDFVAQVEKAIDKTSRGQKPNFVVPAEANLIKLPKLELRSVDLDTLMKAVTTLLSPQRHMWQRVGGSTWVLFTQPDSRSTRAFFVGHLLKKFKIEDITTAIETVFQMGKSTNVDLKYHKDTQLLIIRAQSGQLESAFDVLNQLRDALAFDTTGETPEKVSKKR